MTQNCALSTETQENTAIAVAMKKAFSLRRGDTHVSEQTTTAPTIEVPHQPHSAPQKKWQRSPAANHIQRGMITGVVTNYSHVQGFGNIRGEDGVNYFVNQNEVINWFTTIGFRALRPGSTVWFSPAHGKSDREARRVSYDGNGLRVPKRVKSGPGQNFWHSDDHGCIQLEVGSSTGMIPEGVEPALFLPEEDVAYFYTNRNTSKVSFDPSSVPEGVAVLAIDKYKNQTDSPELINIRRESGFFIVAHRVPERPSLVDFVVRRFGARYDSVRPHKLEYNIETNFLIMEQRLRGTVRARASSVEIANYLREQHASDFNPDRHAAFADPIKDCLRQL